MALNVHDFIANNKPTLLARMLKNECVTSTVMGYLNLFTGIAVKYGRPVESVRIGKLQELRKGVFTARLTFTGETPSRPAMWTPQSDMERFAQAKAKHMAETLRRNPHLEKWFEHMVDVLDSWAQARGTRFEDIMIQNAMVTHDMSTVTFDVWRKTPVG